MRLRQRLRLQCRLLESVLVLGTAAGSPDRELRRLYAGCSRGRVQKWPVRASGRAVVEKEILGAVGGKGTVTERSHAYETISARMLCWSGLHNTYDIGVTVSIKK